MCNSLLEFCLVFQQMFFPLSIKYHNEIFVYSDTNENKDVLCKAKWENMFGDQIIWKTIHSGLIDNWDLNIIIN